MRQRSVTYETAVSHLLETAVSHPLEIDAMAAAAKFLKHHVKGESSERDLYIIHYNARSLHPKIDELPVYCALKKPDIVCISETWLCGEIALLECSIQG